MKCEFHCAWHQHSTTLNICEHGGTNSEEDGSGTECASLRVFPYLDWSIPIWSPKKNSGVPPFLVRRGKKRKHWTNNALSLKHCCSKNLWRWSAVEYEQKGGHVTFTLEMKNVLPEDKLQVLELGPFVVPPYLQSLFFHTVHLERVHLKISILSWESVQDFQVRIGSLTPKITKRRGVCVHYTWIRACMSFELRRTHHSSCGREFRILLNPKWAISTFKALG